jgi:hypothetical protein
MTLERAMKKEYVNLVENMMKGMSEIEKSKFSEEEKWMIKLFLEELKKHYPDAKYDNRMSREGKTGSAVFYVNNTISQIVYNRTGNNEWETSIQNNQVELARQPLLGDDGIKNTEEFVADLVANHKKAEEKIDADVQARRNAPRKPNTSEPFKMGNMRGPGSFNPRAQ